ncbi:hypothetical protein DEO72_LG8g1771 [Vigna unguiculata]|uniref:Uncharacterized protein n=1 Tax=Vigna unguiculata TaxID=3917 RepID=A0A4D6MV15_VIGUN|nr:hypothetical protein DEO72_LG8g1771 [Vigna unguiculata]
MFPLKPTPHRFHDTSPFPQRHAIGDHISRCCSTFPLDFVVTPFALRLRPNNVSTFPQDLAINQDHCTIVAVDFLAGGRSTRWCKWTSSGLPSPHKLGTSNACFAKQL